MSNPQTKEKKVRVFNLAKELNVESKVLLDYCKELGFSGITNQLNGLEPDQAEALKERTKKGPRAGGSHPTPATPGQPPKSVIPPPTALGKPIHTIKAPPKPASRPTESAPPATPTVAPPEPVAPSTPEVEEVAPTATAAVAEPAAPELPAAPEPSTPAEPQPASPTPPRNVIPSLGGSGMRNLNLGGRPTPATPVRPPSGSNPGTATPTPPAAATPPATPPAAPVTPAQPPTPAAQQPKSPPPAPPAPKGPPPNVIPPGAGQPSRPTVLKPPQVAPPKFIAPGRTSSNQAPPPSGPSRGPGSPPRGPSSGPPGAAGGTPPGARPGAPGRPNAPAKTGTGQSVKLTPEMIERLRAASARGQKISINEIQRTPAGAGTPSKTSDGPARPSGPARGPGGPARGSEGEEEDEKKKTGVIGRDQRHKGRVGGDRGRQTGGPRVDRGSVIIGAGGVEVVEQQWGSRRGPRAALLGKLRRRQQQQEVKKEGKIEINIPITVRSLSETIGMKVGELSKRLLKETNQLYSINAPIDFDTASLIAIEKNIELVPKRQKTAEEILIEEFERQEREVDPEKLRPRPPIVTIMGHVDHGKTSLLDKIRRSNVAEGEIGGITQVIRAWSVTHKVVNPDDPSEELLEKKITFLDTPGHEAFTKMRARGANVTDIAVIVVAATDGVMPQTEEAVSHARAAGVRIIVAINKVDAPNANIDRTRRQLYGLELLPDNMGGDIQFVETSAVTGQGIDELLTAISLEAEFNLAEKLQADPDRAATGTCLEAYMTADEGVTTTLLVQQGTLHVGDIVLCGATFGRVRAMYNDLGRPIDEAGPSAPVRITGLGAVPNADDPFYAVDELTRAKEIAEAREKKDREEKLLKSVKVQDLEAFSAAKSKLKITELKVILKAEARGSVEAIRKELEKLTHEEVTTRVLHAGIGAITEADVTLALTSPEDTLIVGFNVTSDDAALKLAEERGISLNEYQIIYNLVDDVKAALEGRLKPIEEVVHLGRAVVRKAIKVGKVGTIAGCYVTSGAIERSARVRLIRGGVVIFPQGEKVVGLDSLKRFKDDVREVREGFECGLKITGYDDIKVDDVIEAFKIEIRHRTL